MIPILNIAGYHFTSLTDLIPLRETLLNMTSALKGTILLSHEGININLAGKVHDVLSFKKSFHAHPGFKTISFRESYCHTLPFKRLKIKIKKEIITF